jgi:glycine/D-amino acid oxidase-like deaminating enzyme
LKHTYNADGSFYLVQTPSGGMVLGGWNLPVVEGREKEYRRVGNDDDSAVMPQWTSCTSLLLAPATSYSRKAISAVLANYCKTRFTGWGPEAYGEGATRTWSGLMTDSKDALPLVGEVPGKEGMYLSAGFHGHGQVRTSFSPLSQF